MKLEAAKRKLHERYQQAEDGWSLPIQIFDIFLFCLNIKYWSFSRGKWLRLAELQIKMLWKLRP